MPIYTGIWWNHASHKLILTLGPKAAGFMSAAIVTWVHFVAISTWPIFRYVLYSDRQKPGRAMDVFHHQTLAMLRNSNGAASAAASVIQMMWGYKRHRRAGTRSVVHLAICVSIFSLWLICGLFAPYIYTRTGPDVLLADSAYCGTMLLNASELVNGNDAFTMFQKHEINLVSAADTYKQQCYNGMDGTKCTDFPRQSLPFEKTNQHCPFGTNNDLCRDVNSTTIHLDTGLLDSNTDFGINAPQPESLKYRRTATCSPLITAGNLIEVNTTGTDLAAAYPPDETLYRYMFGSTIVSKYTFEFTKYQSVYQTDYELTTFQHIAQSGLDNSNVQWTPNATLYAAQDADITLMFLSQWGVRYFRPVYDPIFSAGLDPATDSITVGENNATQYTTSRLVSAIACTEQYQICLPETDICTPLVPSSQLGNATVALMQANNALTVARIATLNKLGLSSLVSGIGNPPLRRGSSVMLAPRTLNGPVQTAFLPINQWELEVENWFSIALAKLQAYVISIAAGPEDSNFYAYVTPPLADSRKATCKTQRVRNMQGKVNFDMSALLVLFVVGAGLIFVGVVFEWIVGFLSEYNRWLRRRWTQYVADGLYQIQRSAFEAKGIKDWRGKDEMLPLSTQIVEAFEREDMVSHESLLYVPK